MQNAQQLKSDSFLPKASLSAVRPIDPRMKQQEPVKIDELALMQKYTSQSKKDIRAPRIKKQSKQAYISTLPTTGNENLQRQLSNLSQEREKCKRSIER